MHATIDPARMTPEERLAEITAILARGLLRLHTRKALPAGKLSDSGQNKLDSGRKTSPDVCPGRERLNSQSSGENGDA